MKLDLDRQEHGRSELAIAGTLPLGLSDGRPGRAELNGELVVDNWSEQERGDTFFGVGSTEVQGQVELFQG